MPRLAFDVDLHRVHGYSEVTGRVCYNSPEWPWDDLLPGNPSGHDVILIEIASPVDTSRKASEAYNRRKWAIGNSLMIGRLLFVAQQGAFEDRILVSPSTKWTEQYDEKTREIMAGCANQDNHDIRACRCMLFFHSLSPSKWVPILQYYKSLSTRATKRKASR